VVSAGDGNDLIYLPSTYGNGNYLIDGGNGIDTLIVNKPSYKFHIVSYDKDFLIQSVGGFDAVSLLQSVENIKFSDFLLDTTSLTKTATLPHSSIVNLVELYIASLRCP
jgi:hypothetical protein